MLAKMFLLRNSIIFYNNSSYYSLKVQGNCIGIVGIGNPIFFRFFLIFFIEKDNGGPVGNRGF